MRTPEIVTSGGEQTALNVSAESVIKDGPGRVCRVSVIVAGAAGSIHDANATATTAGKVEDADGNRIATVPATAGAVLDLDMPVANGIVYKPGAAQVVSISYI